MRHAATLFLLTATASAQAPPDVWTRSLEWVDEPASSHGTTTGNPSADPEGNLVWRFSHASGGGIASAAPWYREALSDMTWDDSWFSSGSGAWSVGDDSGAVIRGTNLTHRLLDAGMGHFATIPVVRFVNDTSTAFTIDVVGSFVISWWGDFAIAPIVDVDVVFAHRDAATGAITALHQATYPKPTPDTSGEGLLESVDLLGVQLDPGDELFWTLRGESATTDSRWVSMFERFSVVRRRVGTSYCTPGNPNSLLAHPRLVGAGSDRAADNALALIAYDLPTNSFGFFLTSRTQGFVVQPGGSEGNLCLGGSIGRFTGAGQIQQAGPERLIRMELDLTQHPTPHLGLVQVVAGDTWNFQYWHRDVGNTSNFSTGLEVNFQ